MTWVINLRVRPRKPASGIASDHGHRRCGDGQTGIVVGASLMTALLVVFALSITQTRRRAGMR